MSFDVAVQENDKNDVPVAHHYLWETIGASKTGQGVRIGRYSDLTVQMLGTFGGSVSLRGSLLDGPDPDSAADWFTLTDPLGNAVTLSAAGAFVIAESVKWISPLSGVGVSDVDLYVKAGTR